MTLPMTPGLWRPLGGSIWLTPDPLQLTCVVLTVGRSWSPPTDEKGGGAMRKLLASTAVLLSVLASGVVASSTVGVSTAGAAVYASKSAFCGANDQIDRGSANITSNAGFLAFLKTHTHDLAVLKKNAPPGALGQTVQQVVSGAEAAISSNNANALNNLPNGASIDTYCGVDGIGNPLPSYFGTGKTTAFCSTFVPVYQDVQNSASSGSKSAALAVLTAHQAQINQLASELSSLPKSIKATATTAVHKAQKAIATQNPSAIGGGNGNGPADHVALYCGLNQ